MSEYVYIIQKWYAGENKKQYMGTYATEYDALEEAIDIASKTVRCRKGNNTHNEPIEILDAGQYRQRVFHPGCRDLWVQVRKTVVK